MKTVVKTVVGVLGVAVVMAILGGGLFAMSVLRRPPLRSIPSTRHASISRTECLECHAPIADEWKVSYHFRSLGGRYWRETKELGYLRVFDALRKPCVNCHAPANVLDLDTGAGMQLGVECTPNLLKSPPGTVPASRSDDPHLGVDCTACHVSRRGILGSGLRRTGVHESPAVNAAVAAIREA